VSHPHLAGAARHFSELGLKTGPKHHFSGGHESTPTEQRERRLES
jgi:hypothetical protein